MFNKILSENSKKYLRSLFAVLLNPLYRMIRYSEEIKHIKNIIKRAEYCGTNDENDREILKQDWNSFIHVLSDRVDKECLRSKIKESDIVFRDKVMKKCYDYTVKYGVRVFCGQNLGNPSFGMDVVSCDDRYAEEGKWEKLEPPFFVRGVMNATLKSNKKR